MNREHSIEITKQKEEYANLLRDETSKWKIEREELENEISKLKKLLNQQQQSQTQVQTQSHSQSQQNQFQDSDLTAIIKDLKESSELLNSGSGSGGSRTTSAGGISKGLSIPSVYSKRTGSSSSSQQNQKMKLVTNNNNSNNYSNVRIKTVYFHFGLIINYAYSIFRKDAKCLQMEILRK